MERKKNIYILVLREKTTLSPGLVLVIAYDLIIFYQVRTKVNTYQYSADTFQDMSEWLVALQTAAFNKTQAKALSTSLLTNDEKQEENLLYCSMDERKFI